MRLRPNARSAAARFGNPAIATAFELDKLYASGKKTAPKGNGGNPVPDVPA